MAVVHRVGVWSVAKIMGAVYGGIGLLVGALIGFFSLIGAAAALSESGAVPSAVVALFSIGFAVAAPILYGLIGMLGGAFLALLYNLFAAVVGGIELDLR